MRALVAFLISFALVGTVGTLILPSPGPRAKPKPPTGSAAVKPTLEFLPGLPSLAVPRIDDTSKRYEEAWRLLKAGQWHTAERAYLQIVTHSPQDHKAIRGLVTLQRLLANQNPKRLQEQAEAYRRAIAEGRTVDDQYTPREMELLAEASLFAMNEIATEQNLKLIPQSRVSISSNRLRLISPPPTNVTRDPVSAIKERISRVASWPKLTPVKPDGPARVLVTDTHHVAPRSIAQTPNFALPGGGNRSGGAIDEIANPVTGNPPGGPTDPGGGASVAGPSSPGSQSNAGVNDTLREGGGGRSGSSSGVSGGSTGIGGSGGAGGGAGGAAGGTGGNAGKEGGKGGK
jgi:hypothetical protein